MRGVVVGFGAGREARPDGILVLGCWLLNHNWLVNVNNFFLLATCCDNNEKAKGHNCFDAIRHPSLLLFPMTPIQPIGRTCPIDELQATWR